MTHYESGLMERTDWKWKGKREGGCSWESPLWQNSRFTGHASVILMDERPPIDPGQWVQVVKDAQWTRGKFLCPLLHDALLAWEGELGLVGILEGPLSQVDLGCPEWVETAPGVRIFPMKTPTLPPATHTNGVILGREELTLVDPGSGAPSEVERLGAFLEAEKGRGRVLQRIFLTHHHVDHTGGVTALQERFDVPVCAHPMTARRLEGKVSVDEYVENEDWLRLSEDWEVQALHTPGHASGHLVLWEAEQEWMVAGDMVAGQGTIVIDPPEGDMGEYLAQLRRMRDLGPGQLVPAHGSFISDPDGLLTAYLDHRMERERSILELLSQLGPSRVDQLVSAIYVDLDPRAIPLAIRQLLAHLLKLEKEDRVTCPDGRLWSRPIDGSTPLR